MKHSGAGSRTEGVEPFTQDSLEALQVHGIECCRPGAMRLILMRSTLTADLRRAVATSKSSGCATKASSAQFLAMPALIKLFVTSARFRSRPIVGRLNRFLASARLRRRLAKETRPLRVEVGAGNRHHLDGWICTDVEWNCKYYLDITKPWPIEPGAVQYVYGDNVIEHLTLTRGRTMLQYARAAMAAGGTIRLATPDLGRIATLYLQGPQKEVERLMSWHRRYDRLAEHPGDLLRIAFTYWGHHAGYLYDLPTLKAELERAGFANVRTCSTSRSTDPVLRGLESRTDEETDIQLVVEATASMPPTDRKD